MTFHECELLTEAEHGEDLYICNACDFIGNLSATIAHVVAKQPDLT